jgi:hypothetical protein
MASFDPYGVLDGNDRGSQDSKKFFNPGTKISQPAVLCTPQVTFAVGTYPTGGDSANPASQPAPDPTPPSTCPGPGCGLGPTNAELTATGAVMYEWIDSTTSGGTVQQDPELTPDAEVIIWTLPKSKMFPAGAFELEFDNWCSKNDGGFGEPPKKSAEPSFTWNGNHYTYYKTCAEFSGDDLVLSASGVLIGYVENSPTNVTYSGDTVDGWKVAYRTTTTLAILPDSTTTETCVNFQAAVAGLPEGPIPTGTVTFLNGETPLGAASLNSAGVAIFGTSQLASGNYNVTASYSGNASGNANHSSSSVSTSRSLKVTKHQKNDPVTTCPKT